MSMFYVNIKQCIVSHQDNLAPLPAPAAHLLMLLLRSGPSRHHWLLIWHLRPRAGGGFNSDKSQAQFFFIRVICCPHCVKWEQKQSRGRLSATVAPLAAGFRVLNNFWSVGNNLKLFQWNIIILIFQSAWEWQHIGTCSWRITLCCFWRRAESGDGWSSLLLP